MKICLITNLYKPYARGGAETVVDVQAEGLKKQGHKVVIITTKPFFANVKCQMSNVECYYLNGLYYSLNRIPKFLRIFWHIFDMFDLGSYFRIKKILKKEKPDLVITHCLKGVGFLIPRAIKKLKIKHIHTLHDIQLLHPSGLMYYGKEKILEGFFAKIYQNICRLLFNSPDVIISPSKWLMGLHEERKFFKNSKKLVMPNPVKKTENRKQKTELKNSTNNFKFIYVGQIEEHKGVLFLVKAFKKISPLRKGGWGVISAELIIAGGGSQFEEAKKEAEENTNIKILGRINHREALGLMRRADCLIVPSLCYDNSPMVIYEAFAVGLPVIGAEIGGIPELLNKNAGLLFKPGDEEDLINKIKYALENKSYLENISETGSGKIKNLGVEEYVEKLVNL